MPITSIDYTRKHKRRSVYLFLDDFPSDESPLHPCVPDSTTIRLAEADETMAHIIKQAVTELSPKQKQVFILRYYQDLALREIGETMGLQIGTIKSHLFNALRNLRQLLADYGRSN